MSHAEKKNRVSVWNWLLTLILYAIPGVNLISCILFIIFAKTQPKRSSAIAMLILILLGAALTCAAFIFFPAYMSDLAAKLRGTAPALELPPVP